LRTARAAAAALLVAAVVAAAGCITVGGESASPVSEYDLVPEQPRAPPAVAALTTRTTLQLEPFGASELLDREGIVWRRDDVEVGSYVTHRWARPPEQAVRAALATTLRRAFAPGAVAAEPRLADPDFVIRASLTRCEEVDRGDRWFGVIELHLTLARRDGVELLRRTYAGEELARMRHPRAVVVALRHVLGRIADDVARDVVAASSRALPGEDLDHTR
jgi:uncharacterized lipoprotein YmbA